MSSDGIIERLKSGLSYSEYLDAWRKDAGRPLAGLDKDERKMAHYARYNIERHDNVASQYVPSDKLMEALAGIDSPQTWMLLSEHWCGDAAFALPIIGPMAEASDHIDLRIIYRDENLDIMDRYLTNGTRSIPKLVAFAEDGSELFQWGPRPAVVQAERQKLVDEGLASEAIVKRVVELYEEGLWKETEKELTALISESVELVA